MRRYLALACGVLCTLLASGSVFAADSGKKSTASTITVGQSSKNDVSPPLRDIPPKLGLQPRHLQREPLGMPGDVQTRVDPVVQDRLAPQAMPAPILDFDGIHFPGVSCNCAPPDTNGEVGATQYLQMVNEGIQVFDKTSGTSVLGPISIATLWSGFGGVCETGGSGDPVVLYDQLANRWVVSQFAGTTVPRDECVAVSTTSDATGTWYRYDFHLNNSNFYDYPKLGVWPDAYYLSMNVFNTGGTTFLGPQPFALDRASMIAGAPATFITPGLQSTSLGTLICADLDGWNLPPAGAPNPILSTQGSPWKLYRFHVDWVTPANSTFTLGGSLTPAGYTTLTAGVPQLGTTDLLDNLADRPMFRLAYRRFLDGHEALVGNRTVSSSSIAGIRWWEINNATSGSPGFTQQGTYQPDTTWRWMGSAAMDSQGDLALGFSASSASIHPEIRYAGRLAGDPAGTLGSGRSDPVRGHRQPDPHQRPMGRLQRPDGGPGRRLHLLVHAGVLRNHRQLQLAHARRQLQIPRVHEPPASDLDADGDAHQYSNSDAGPTDPDSDQHADQYVDSYVNSHQYADLDADEYANSNSSTANPDSDQHANQYADEYADPYGNSDKHGDAGAADADPDQYFYRHADEHPDPHCHPDHHADEHPDADTDPHADAHRHAHHDADTDPDTDAEPGAHRDEHADADAGAASRGRADGRYARHGSHFEPERGPGVRRDGGRRAGLAELDQRDADIHGRRVEHLRSAGTDVLHSGRRRELRLGDARRRDRLLQRDAVARLLPDDRLGRAPGAALGRDLRRGAEPRRLAEDLDVARRREFH